MAAANTAISGQIKYTSVINCTLKFSLSSLISVGASSANADAVVAIPTHKGRTAFVLSAAARSASASAAA